MSGGDGLVGVVLVSHSAEVASAVAALATGLAGGGATAPVAAAGGTPTAASAPAPSSSRRRRPPSTGVRAWRSWWTWAARCSP